MLSIIRYKDPTIKKKVTELLARWGLAKKLRTSGQLKAPLTNDPLENSLSGAQMTVQYPEIKESDEK